MQKNAEPDRCHKVNDVANHQDSAVKTRRGSEPHHQPLMPPKEAIPATDDVVPKPIAKVQTSKVAQCKAMPLECHSVELRLRCHCEMPTASSHNTRLPVFLVSVSQYGLGLKAAGHDMT